MNTEQEAPRPRSALQGRGVRLSVRLHLHAVGFALLLVPIAMASVFCFPQYLYVKCPRPLGKGHLTSNPKGVTTTDLDGAPFTLLQILSIWSANAMRTQ